MAEPKDLQNTIANLVRELAKDPKSTSFVQLADAYRQSGQLDDALEVALRGTWELPEFAPGYAAVGRIYMQRQVVSKAATAFQKAIEADARCLDAYKGMARLKREQGDLDAAAVIIARALTLFPDDPMLKQMQASLPVAIEAVPAAQKVQKPPAVRADGGVMKPITTATIAEIYMEQGLYGQALEVYRELLAATPQDAALQRKIADIQALARGEVPASIQQMAAVPVEQVSADSVDESHPPVSAGLSVLETLDGWLTAIQARRNSV